MANNLSQEIVSPLLDWYDTHATNLPWHGASPYGVWLSEIMLQQTQVETVISYYTHFMKKYPHISQLANASLDAILKQWEGLGYYSRARNLHKTARIIATEMDSHFPQTVHELMKLPGIGRYTAGAIASIAFNQVAPVLDGNVIRVFARLIDLDDDVTESRVKNKLWDMAEKLVPQKRSGDYNQALMQLGQKICTPRQPNCHQCPIQAVCKAFANDTQVTRPVKKKRQPIPHYDVAAGIIRDESGRLLIAQRPLEGLLGGLWEFPGGKQETGESLPQCLKRELREELAIEVEVGDLFVQVKHAFTHFKITLHAYNCRYQSAMSPYTEPQTLEVANWAWVTDDELTKYSFGKADREVIRALDERRKMLF
ncbi:MAG: A/G-specific adenine glycosylase [Anaerolineae bacterium]|nr:A/G-specific adenine glycosylase [Anaerolineae bacterium]